MWMSKWTKIAALLFVACVTALTWTQSSYCDGGCVVRRGIDPLDILNATVRHNVWIILDTSGSMRDQMGGGKKLDVAKDVLNELMMDELVDAQGQALVNWGFVHYAVNSRSTSTECSDQFTNQCAGLDLANMIDPPSCGAGDNRPAIVTALYGTNHSGYTPNGISLDQISQQIVSRGYVSGLLEDQKNFVIIVTDGDDTCECGDKDWETGNTDVPLRYRSDVPTLGGSFNSDDDLRAKNAGTKGNLAYERLNTDPLGVDTATYQANGSLGNIFVIGMFRDNDTDSIYRANHLAWESSGARHGNPDMQGALFAYDREALKQQLLNVFAKIGVPETEVSLGTPVVGSVKELIPEIPGLLVDDAGSPRAVTPDDVIADVATPDLNDVTFARRLRTVLKNNVLFTTSVRVPGFKGHLRAHNVFKVRDFEIGQGVRSFDDTQTNYFLGRGTHRNCEDLKNPGNGIPGCFWDAGIALQDRYPDDRTILFNRRGDAPGTAPMEFRTPDDPYLAGPTLSWADWALVLDVGTGYLTAIDSPGVSCPEDAVRAVIQVMRGWRLVVDPTYGIYQDGTRACGTLNFSSMDATGAGTWKLYDPANLGPAVVQNPPRSADANPPMHNSDAYGFGTFPNGFYWEHLNRQTLVYLPTNGGMVHAFRADNGAELFAYIPADALGDWAHNETPNSRNTLRDLVPLIVADNNGISNHKFFMAASPTVEDVYLRAPAGDDAWHTALVFGRGKGGKFVSALDVSNIPDWDGSTYNTYDRLDPANLLQLPKILFTVGNHQGISDAYDGLGETWSVPLIGNVKATNGEDQWVVFLGAGYGCHDQGTAEGQFFYVLEMEDGSVYKSFQVTNDPAAPIPYNGLVASPVLYNPHEYLPNDSEDYTTRAYISDLQGRVHKLSCGEQDPNNWTFVPFYEFGVEQPITAQAALYRDGVDLYLAVGTGGDARVDATVNTFQFATLLDANNSSQGQLVWTLDLPYQERVIVPPVGIGEADKAIVFFASTRSELNAATCTMQFSGTLFGLGLFTGLGVFDLDPATTGDQTSVATTGKTTGIFGRDGAVYVSQSGGIEAEGGTLILGDKDFEDKLDDASASNGTVTLLVRGFRMSPF